MNAILTARLYLFKESAVLAKLRRILRRRVPFLSGRTIRSGRRGPAMGLWGIHQAELDHRQFEKASSDADRAELPQ